MLRYASTCYARLRADESAAQESAVRTAARVSAATVVALRAHRSITQSPRRPDRLLGTRSGIRGGRVVLRLGLSRNTPIPERSPRRPSTVPGSGLGAAVGAAAVVGCG